MITYEEVLNRDLYGQGKSGRKGTFWLGQEKSGNFREACNFREKHFHTVGGGKSSIFIITEVLNFFFSVDSNFSSSVYHL